VKQLVLVAVLAAFASSAITLLLAPAPPRAAAVPAAPATDFKAALADLEREVSALRLELAARDRPATAVPVPAAAGTPSSVHAPATAAAEAGPVPSTPAVEMSTVAARFREMAPYVAEGVRDKEAHEEQKRRWMLRGEKEVLEWFGRPRSIDATGEQEVWTYRVPSAEINQVTGLPDEVVYWVRINRGRVIDLGD